MKSLLFKINAILCALMISVGAWGITSTADQSTLNGNFNSDTHSTSWTASHVTFKLSGSSLYTTLGFLYMPHNSTYTLSWTVEEGFDIKVTKVVVVVDRASGVGYKMKVGNGSLTKDLFYSWNVPSGGVTSGTMSCGNNDNVSIVANKAGTWSTVAVKSITVTYTLKPKFSATNGSVEVTVCLDNKHLVDLTSLCHPVSAHVTNHSYKIKSASGASVSSAHIIDGNKFYATSVGSYTLRDTTGYEGCHNANYADFTINVTPATLSLTAPTASDITYPGTLATSTLTGGKAMAGSCEVEGSWAWQSPGTKPAIGDNQSFPVVFTPSTAAGNYTTATTNATVNVVACIFTGEGDDDDRADIWGKNDNWNVNATPDSDNVVLIRHDAIIEDEVAAYSVVIEDGYTLTIMPTGGLTVGKGGIIGATQDNLILRAGQEGDEKGQTGYLRIDPESAQPMPAATVELYCKAYYNKAERETSKAAWQMVGVPISNEGVAAKSVFTKSWIYNWDEESNDWVNNRATLTFAPFVGYETTQYKYPEGILLVFTGNLVDGNSVKSIDLTHDGYGYNALANSFMAPIDISRMDESDFVNAEAAVNILNMGTQEQSKNPAKSVDAPGQYISIPVKSAEVMADKFNYPLVVPPMQGFFVKAKGDGAKVNLDYSKLVWGVDYSDLRDTKPLRAPERMTESSTIGALKITIAANELVDHAYLLESDQYDTAYENGYDALKMQSGDINIFTVEGNEQLAVDATNSIAGTRIGVRTGDTTAYVMTFTHLNGEPLALYDSETGLTWDIEEGTEYTFYAAPNSEIVNRFQIVKRANDPTGTADIDETNSVRAHKFIKDGQLFILKNGVLYTATGAVVR